MPRTAPSSDDCRRARRGVGRSPAAHAAILDAAVALAARGGPQAITMEAVAREAGVGKQTIYRWWPTRGHLLVEVYRHLVPAELLAKPDRQPDSGETRLRHLLEALFTTLRTSPAGPILAALIADAQSDPAVSRLFRESIIEGRRDVLLTPIRAAVAAGDLPAGTDPHWASDLIVALVWRHLLVEPAALDGDFADRILSVLKAG